MKTFTVQFLNERGQTHSVEVEAEDESEARYNVHDAVDRWTSVMHIVSVDEI